VTEFTKLHGLGNDYIYLNAFTERIEQYDLQISVCAYSTLTAAKRKCVATASAAWPNMFTSMV